MNILTDKNILNSDPDIRPAYITEIIQLYVHIYLFNLTINKQKWEFPIKITEVITFTNNLNDQIAWELS